MRLFRKTLLALAAIVLIASFTACSSEDNKDGYLYKAGGDITNNDGSFFIDLLIDKRDIRGYNRYDNVSRINLFESYLNISVEGDFKRGDMVDLVLYTSNLPDYHVRIPIERITRNIGIDDYYMNGYGEYFGDFMQELLDEIASTSGAMLRVDGYITREGRPLRGYSLKVELDASVDIITWNI